MVRRKHEMRSEERDRCFQLEETPAVADELLTHRFMTSGDSKIRRIGPIVGIDSSERQSAHESKGADRSNLSQCWCQVCLLALTLTQRLVRKLAAKGRSTHNLTLVLRPTSLSERQEILHPIPAYDHRGYSRARKQRLEDGIRRRVRPRSERTGTVRVPLLPTV